MERDRHQSRHAQETPRGGARARPGGRGPAASGASRASATAWSPRMTGRSAWPLRAWLRVTPTNSAVPAQRSTAHEERGADATEVLPRPALGRGWPGSRAPRRPEDEGAERRPGEQDPGPAAEMNHRPEPVPEQARASGALAAELAGKLDEVVPRQGEVGAAHRESRGHQRDRQRRPSAARRPTRRVQPLTRPEGRHRQRGQEKAHGNRLARGSRGEGPPGPGPRERAPAAGAARRRARAHRSRARSPKKNECWSP